MSNDAPRTGIANVQAELKVGQRRLNASFSVPAGPTRLQDVLPILQHVANAIVDAGVEDAEAQGRCVSCTKGCGACCRQLVPISEVEARNIRDLVAAMPEPRRSQVQARFAAARQQLDAAGLLEKLNNRANWQPEVFNDIGMDYFYQGIPCPFLEEESCSIHLDRPITCREYLVTSPAANCAHPSKENIDKIEMPAQVWPSLARMSPSGRDAKFVPWVPLVLAPQWADEHPDDIPLKPGPELLRELFEILAKNSPTAQPTATQPTATAEQA